MGLNPTKRNAYRVIEDGLIVLHPDAIAGIQIPGVDIETDEHVQNNHRKKTPSIINVEDFEIDLFEDQKVGNGWWLTKIPYDQKTGAFLDPSAYEFDLVIEKLKYDRKTPIRRFTIKGCTAIASSFEKSEKNSTENQKRTITISPHMMIEESL